MPTDDANPPSRLKELPMSIPQSAGGPISSRADLVAHLAAGSKPRADWRIGTEHEKFVYGLKTYKPLPYEGPTGIRALLEGMERFGWAPIREGESIIGLSQDGAAISLEPGGDGFVRQFAVPREQAERIPLLSQSHLDRCRQ